MAIELDYMEYANDAAARAAYVKIGNEYGGSIQDLGSGFSSGYTGINEHTSYRIGEAGTVTEFKYYTTTADVNIKAKVFRINGANYDFVGESETFSTIAGGATRVLTTQIPNVQSGDMIGWYINGLLSFSFSGSSGSGCNYIQADVTGTTAINTWTIDANSELAVSCIVTNLQCYSENTIKEQGDYSLKGIALITNSLNDTLTRTVAPTIDLTDRTQIKFDIRASRTGSQIKIGIHDSGGTTTEHTANVAQANVWQNETWDISGVSNANKDDIDSIIITIVNADVANTFYVDNMYEGLVVKALAEAFGVADSAIKTGAEQLAEAFSVVDSWVARIALSEAFSIVDSKLTSISKALADAFSIVDSKVTKIYKVFAEAFSIVMYNWRKLGYAALAWVREDDPVTAWVKEDDPTTIWVRID